MSQHRMFECKLQNHLLEKWIYVYVSTLGSGPFQYNKLKTLKTQKIKIANYLGKNALKRECSNTWVNSQSIDMISVFRNACFKTSTRLTDV